MASGPLMGSGNWESHEIVTSSGRGNSDTIASISKSVTSNVDSMALLALAVLLQRASDKYG